MAASLANVYIIRSNRESGEGRYDISIEPRDIKTHKNGVIIELKSDFTGSESIGGLSFKYKKNDSILNLGNRNYEDQRFDSL